MHPRHLLVMIALTMAVVGSQTFRYPPEFLAYPHVWALLAFVASALSLTCALVPFRPVIASSGAILVTLTLARSFAILAEVVAGDFKTKEAAASFVIGGTVWSLVAVLIFVVWREYIIPWSLGFR